MNPKPARLRCPGEKQVLYPIAEAGNQGKSLIIECDPAQKITKHIALKHGFVWAERKDGLDVYRLHQSS